MKINISAWVDDCGQSTREEVVLTEHDILKLAEEKIQETYGAPVKIMPQIVNIEME